MFLDNEKTISIKENIERMKEETQKEKENLLKEYKLNFYSKLKNFTGKSKIQEVQPSEILDYLQKNNIEYTLEEDDTLQYVGMEVDSWRLDIDQNISLFFSDWSYSGSIENTEWDGTILSIQDINAEWDGTVF